MNRGPPDSYDAPTYVPSRQVMSKKTDSTRPTRQSDTLTTASHYIPTIARLLRNCKYLLLDTSWKPVWYWVVGSNYRIRFQCSLPLERVRLWMKRAPRRLICLRNCFDRMLTTAGRDEWLAWSAQRSGSHLLCNENINLHQNPTQTCSREAPTINQSYSQTYRLPSPLFLFFSGKKFQISYIVSCKTSIYISESICWKW